MLQSMGSQRVGRLNDWTTTILPKQYLVLGLIENPWTSFVLLTSYHVYFQLPRWLSGKESACQCRRPRFNPWVEKIAWRRKWPPTPVFLLGNPMDRGAWQAPVCGVTESDTNEYTHIWMFISFPTNGVKACYWLARRCNPYVDLPRIEPRCLAPRADCLPSEPPGKLYVELPYT